MRDRSKRRARRVVSLALVLSFRILAVLVSLHLSGVGALVMEAVGADAAADDCCTDCPLEKDGKQCPPSCPHCSCHGSVALPLVREASADVGVEHPILESEMTPYEACVPRAPPQRGVYRPPRLVSSAV